MRSPLFDRDDRAAILDVRKALGEIVGAAYGANRVEDHEDLLKLSGMSVNLFDPAIAFPDMRESYVPEALTIVEASLPQPADRRRLITTRITATTWSLKASLLFEADLAANTWACLDAPHGHCSHRRQALAGLKALARQYLVFTPID